MCGPEEGKNQPADFVKEAIDMEQREGFSDRRHQPKFNGSMKVVVSFLAGILIAIVLPQLMDLNRGGGSALAQIGSLEKRTAALETRMAEGGRWTEGEQLDYALDQQNEITKLQVADATIVQELKDIRLILADIQKTVRDIDRRTR